MGVLAQPVPYRILDSVNGPERRSRPGLLRHPSPNLVHNSAYGPAWVAGHNLRRRRSRSTIRHRKNSHAYTLLARDETLIGLCTLNPVCVLAPGKSARGCVFAGYGPVGFSAGAPPPAGRRLPR